MAGHGFKMAFIAVMLVIIVGSTHCFAAPMENKESQQSPLLIKDILDKMLKPLKNILMKQINSIIWSIADQANHITDQIKGQIDKFINIIWPVVRIIINSMGDAVGEGQELKGQIERAVESIFEYLGVNDSNQEAVQILMDYIIEQLYTKITLENSLQVASRSLRQDSEAQFLISGIIELLLRPLKNLLKSQIDSIINCIIDQGGHISGSVISKIELLVELIRPFVIKLIDKINDIVGQGVELKKRIEMAIESIFEYLEIITETNKEIVRLLVNFIADLILGSSNSVQLGMTSLRMPKFGPKVGQWLIKPIIDLVVRQLNSLLLVLLDQLDHAAERLLEYVDVIAELIRPAVIRIIDLTNNVHGEIHNLKEQVHAAVTRIFENLTAIGNVSAEIVALLIDAVTDAIVDMIKGKPSLAVEAEKYLFIDMIAVRLIRPVADSINEVKSLAN